MEPTLHRLPRFPHARALVAVLIAVILPLAALSFTMLVPGAVRHGFAAAVTPPPPPTYVPTVIPPPPGPPTPTPTAAPPTVTPTATAAGTSAATPTSTATATPTKAAASVFSLDAVRVSKLHDPGDLAGLSAVRPGSHVWLMIYYTLYGLPHNVNRVATYDILKGSSLLYRIVYRETEKAGASGRRVKYTEYHLPAALPFGSYRFRATLTLAGTAQVKQWKFHLARHDHVVYATGSS